MNKIYNDNSLEYIEGSLLDWNFNSNFDEYNYINGTKETKISSIKFDFWISNPRKKIILN